MESDGDPCFKVHNFNDETIMSTPLPQATSTVDKKPDLVPEVEVQIRQSGDSGRTSGYLSDGLLSLNKLQEELRAVMERHKCALKHEGELISPETQLPMLNKGTIELEPLSCKILSHSFPQQSEPPEETNNPIVSKSIVAEQEFDGVLSNSESRSASLPSHAQKELEVFDRRATYTFRDDADADRQSAREKALKALAYDDLHLGILRPESQESKKSFFDLDNLGTLQLPPEASGHEAVSGFSELLQESDLRRDEQFCAENFMELKPIDRSLPGINDCSQMTEYFRKGLSNSFFEFLGPSQIKYPEEHFASSLKDKENCSLQSVDLLSGVPQLSAKEPVNREEVLKDVNDLRKSETIYNGKDHQKKSPSSVPCVSGYNDSKTHVSVNTDSILKTLNELKCVWDTSLCSDVRSGKNGLFNSEPFADDSLSIDVPRVSEIAQVLKNTDVAATPTSLVKKVMDSHHSKSFMKDETTRVSRNISDCSSIFLNETNTEKHYEIRVVYGGGAELLICSDIPDKDSIWSVQDHDVKKVLLKIKQISPSSVAIPVFPIVKEDIDIRILEVSLDRKLHTFHNISLIIEPPQVQFEGLDVFDFGKVPECTVAKIPFKIRCINSNMVVITSKIEQGEDMISLVFDDTEASTMIDVFPVKPVTGNLILSPKYGFCKDASKIVHWQSSIKLCLVPLLNEEVISEVKIKADIFKYSLQISLKNNVVTSGEDKEIALRNQSPCEVNIEISTSGRFIVSPSKISLPSGCIGKLQVGYVPLRPVNSEGEIVLTALPGGLNHAIKVFGKCDETYSKSINGNDFISPNQMTKALSMGSANTSVTSGSGSYEVDGPLQLLSSQICLIWPSRTIGCDSCCIKKVLITTKNDRKEKLIFEMHDPTGSYQFVDSDYKRKTSLVTTVSHSTRREISVDFTPKKPGQIKGQIIIKRVSSDTTKRTLDLYGFGGLGRLQAENVDFDLDNKSFQVKLSSREKKGQFTLQNVGDGIAFFNITIKNITGLFVEISPTKGLLDPGKKTTVTLSLNLERVGSGPLEEILRKNKNQEILLMALSIVFGDQPTRLRISRVYKKHKKDPLIANSSLLSVPMESLCNMFPSDKSNKQSVNLLKDPLKYIWDIFEKGINEWFVGVVINRSVLQEIVLDSTQYFVSLQESQLLDETECSTFESSSFLLSSHRY